MLPQMVPGNAHRPGLHCMTSPESIQEQADGPGLGTVVTLTPAEGRAHGEPHLNSMGESGRGRGGFQRGFAMFICF